MNIALLGAGVWGRGLCGIADLRARYAEDAPLGDVPFVAPKPEAIPSRERRRAGLTINLAVAVAHEACEVAGIDKSEVPSVFVSAMGDTDITDYMCRKLTHPEKLLSPTKFHNSVHNAPSGYWSISAENRAPSTFVGGYRESFGAGLLEAASQVQATRQPVLLVGYDIQDHAPFSSVTRVDESLACALVLAPGDHIRGDAPGLQVLAQVTPNRGTVEPGLPHASALAEVAAANPVGVGLTLLEAMVAVHDGESADARVCVPAARRIWLDVRLTPAVPG